MGQVGRITYPDSGPIGKLGDLFANLAGSVDAALPVKFVATLAALNAIGLTDDTPAGTIAVLDADDSGLAAGAQFILNPNAQWLLSGTCTALNVDTFVAALQSNANVRVQPGAMAWNAVTAGMVAFTTTQGLYSAITLSKQVSGAGTLTQPIAAGDTFSVAVAFPAGSFPNAVSNVLVSCESPRLTPAVVTPTKDGFTLQFGNWSGGASPASVPYRWTAFA